MVASHLPLVSKSLPDQVTATIELIREQYADADAPWILGFSGGKDSSALLRLVYAALLGLKRRDTRVSILYCDTGVEIPVVAGLVRRTLRQLSREAKTAGLPFEVRVAH